MEKERAFKDLLALCVKRWKTLIVGMIVGALTVGYVQYNVQMELKNDPEISDEAIEERYQTAMAEYDAKIKAMDDMIALDENNIETYQEYIDNSLLMLIDPYNKYTTVIDVAIEITDDKVFTQNYGYSTTPVDYIVSKIQNQYMADYGNIDVSKLEGLQEIHRDLLPKYWNEVLSVTTKTGGMIEIRACGPTEAESQKIVETLYSYLCSRTETICQSAYEHSFIMVSDVTKVEIDTGLEDTQNYQRKVVTNAKSDIETQKQNKLNLELPEREKGFDEEAMKAAIIRFAIMGLGIGLIGAMFVIMLHAIAVRQVITSEEIVKNCKVVYLGALTKSAYKRKMPIRRFSDYLSGERLWKTKDEAIEYIMSSLSAGMEGEKIVLTSTQKLKESDLGVQALKEALENEKKEVALLFDAPHNAKLSSAMKDADVVILLEKAVVSRMNAIDAVKDTCERLGVKNVGFVLMTK